MVKINRIIKCVQSNNYYQLLINILIPADFMKNVHQTEDLHLMITSEIDLLTPRTILHMTLLLTLPTPKREDI